MDRVVEPGYLEAARKLRAHVAAFEAKRDLIALGAYAKGSDRDVDDAIARMPRIEALLRQSPNEKVPFQESVEMLRAAVR
jgi:flagellar biosynthesis/type III secretory pathway ATPase